MAEQVKDYFLALQRALCNDIQDLDGNAIFSEDIIPGYKNSFSKPRVLSNGANIEKAAVNFTYSIGENLPPAASERRPSQAGKPFQALSISLIIHPRNPFVPTTHMNLRFFSIEQDRPEWYFGGGYDLTPFYGFVEDAVSWHENAQSVTGAHYPQMKKDCDDYFFLPHRDEQRGIGGIFFDDFALEDFDETFQFVKNVGDSFFPAYKTIFERRVATPFEPKHREFQLYRRSRYAEFNLIVDRGTRYGLQSGRRIESVLSSMPPLVAWKYQNEAQAGSREHTLTDYYLKPRNWLESEKSKE